MKTSLKLMGRPLFLLCFFVVGFNLYAESASVTADLTESTFTADLTESVFTLELRREIVISTLSLGVFFGSFLIPETYEIPNLDRNNVIAIDRWLMFNYGSFNIVTTFMRPVVGVMPLIVPLVLMEWDLRNDFPIWLTYGIMYAQAVGFTYGTRRAIGRAVNRHRPIYYFADVVERPIPANAFPSGTTSMSFLPATMLSVTFSAEFPDSPWRIPVIVGSHTLATTVGIARIITGHHFLTDVLAGAAIGSFFGWLIPTLHRRPGNDDESNLSFRFTGNGAMMSVRL